MGVIEFDVYLIHGAYVSDHIEKVNNDLNINLNINYIIDNFNLRFENIIDGIRTST